MEISQEVFEQQRRPRFGNANPERLQLAFWEWMIRGEQQPETNKEGGLAGLGFVMQEGKLKSGYGPYRAREFFEVPLNREDGPIWTFDRTGRTTSELPDGRVLHIGGEHEDFYDPDFCIYNDIVVFGPEDQVDIYGYPKEVFPPTDFHTATLIGDRIIVVGCLGYRDARRIGYTPVYSLDLSSYRMSEIRATGEMPGWIFEHNAELQPNDILVVRGGQLIEERSGEHLYRRNVEDYALDTRSGIWRRLTKRNWRQFSICQEDGGLFVLNHDVKVQDLVPNSLESIAETEESYRERRFLVRGVPVRVVAGVKWIEIIVEGDLPQEICHDMPEVFRSRVETLCKKKCIVM
jgi:hypothetical protein